ncbi:telomeric repeat-binding factor 1-like [Olea europaea subsp. europaea]|uniref:Telomeric repeat-binding factor 1-like n=2 Tax=Olea europaea subsp. europaea TaxID=158383 RepID=A0A8S0U7Z1_OLEEU|nr:telomeric repeat-binding factor 1-like [Olea europaea subsp. europaea]
MDWSERELCINCDEGGKLLICSENGCPIAVHEKCMGSPAGFDERGLFYCPYCLYRKAVAEKSPAWENAMSKKKALSIFIDKEIIGGAKQGEKKERALVKSLNGNVNKTICYNGNNDTDIVHNLPIQLEEEPQGEGISHECTRRPSPYKVADASVLDRQNDELTGSSEGHKEDVHVKNSSEVQEKTIPSRRALDNTERQGQRIDSTEEEEMQEDVQQILAAPTGVPSPYKVADASILDSQNDELTGSSEDHNEDTRMKDSTELQETSFPSRGKLDNIERQGQRIGNAEEEKMQEEIQEISAAPTGEVPLVRLHSRDKRGLKMNNLTYGESEVISLRSKRVKRSDMNKVLSISPSKGADASRSDNQNDVLSGSSKGYKEDSHLKDSTEEQETIILSRRKPDNIEMQEEQRISSAEEEKMQDKELETSVRYSDEVPLVRAHSKSRREVETNKSVSREPGVISTRSKDVKRSEMNKKQSPGVKFPRRSSRRSSSFNTVKNGKVNIEMQEEQRISSAEEEKMQDEEQETSAASTDEVPLVWARSKSKRGVETIKLICRDSEVISTRSKDVKRSEMNKKKSPGIDFPRRSSRRSSSDLGFNTVKNGNINVSSCSRLLELPSAKSPKDPFRNDRRKKLLWTEEEQEMLQEGVEKFSSQANKNIPWRKVLEFGRHVFHGTRTPADLKDKWRNMAK